VDDAVQGRLRGKWTPIEVSQRFRRLAMETLAALDRARAKAVDPKSAVFRATQLDLEVLAGLAQYHAEKTMAATQLAFFETTREAGRLPRALAHSRQALAHWQRLAQLTDGVYYDHLVFGSFGDDYLSRLGHSHSGHWKDRLPELRDDVRFLEGLVQAQSGTDKAFREYPGETPLGSTPQFEHEPASAIANADLTIAVKVSSGLSLDRVILHYRAVDQTVDWRELEMRHLGGGRYEAIVPGKEILERWDFMYYFEALVKGGGGRLWPSWEQGAPYIVVKVNRSAASN